MLNVFLSWSGPRSLKTAEVLGRYIRLYLPGTVPFISTHIESGQRWFDMIAKELEIAHFGILCVTKANVTSPWLHFEAGALAKHHFQSNVCLFLLDTKPSELKKPLSEYQATSFSKGDIKKLFQTINKKLGEQTRNENDISDLFENVWVKFEEDLKGAASVDETTPLAKRQPEDILEEVLATTRELADRFPLSDGLLRGWNTFEYINGEREAMQALIDATMRAKRHIRATRFFPHAIKNTFPAYGDAIAKRVLGEGCEQLEHYFRIVAANSLNKLDDVLGYIDQFKGRSFTFYLTEFTNEFELVVIDESEVFIHFYEQDLVIASTLHLVGRDIAQNFARIFTRLHDPKKSTVQKFECRYMNDENIAAQKEMAKNFFETHSPKRI